MRPWAGALADVFVSRVPTIHLPCIIVPHTTGQVQSLLNQTLIPCTMLCSAIYLRTRFSSVQLFGAALVLLGALFTVVAPSLGQTGATATANAAPTVTGRRSAELLYFLSNIPVACSQVGKCGRAGLDYECGAD